MKTTLAFLAGVLTTSAIGALFIIRDPGQDTESGSLLGVVQPPEKDDDAKY